MIRRSVRAVRAKSRLRALRFGRGGTVEQTQRSATHQDLVARVATQPAGFQSYLTQPLPFDHQFVDEACDHVDFVLTLSYLMPCFSYSKATTERRVSEPKYVSCRREKSFVRGTW